MLVLGTADLPELDGPTEAVLEHAGSTHGLSPRVYWVRYEPAAHVEAVAHHDGAGAVTYYSDDFAAMLYDVDREWE